MASNMLPLRPVVAPLPPTTSSGGGHKSQKWWGPLFGFSSEPEYLNPVEKPAAAADGDTKPAKTTRVAPGCFTESKARRFRKMTCDSSSFHETMYHSAIASRLASDFSDHFAD